MTGQISLADIQQALNLPIAPDLVSGNESGIKGISTDSRSLQPGELFVALKGKTFDGHQFIPLAQERGAVAIIVDAAVNLPPLPQPQVPLLRVKDTLIAYQTLAQWWRMHWQIPVIAVTGSVGKTTTKELIAAVLRTIGTPPHREVLKSQANYNNEIGVPKTLLQMGPEHAYAVIEMGMRGRGEIARLGEIARPDVGVITNVGTAHIERLGSEQAIAEAKCELLSTLPPTGIAILNADNPRLMATAATVWSGTVFSYGLTAGNFRAELTPAHTLKWQGLEFPVPLPGQHQALNYLAALAVAHALGLDLAPLQAGISVELPGGRGRRYCLEPDIVLLDETYNAGVESMTAALHLLAQTPGQRRIAVLGTMRELGEWSVPLHRQVGQVVQRLNLDHLLILADPPEAAALAEGAAPLVAEAFPDASALLARLQALIQPGDRLLFKASRAVALDQVVDQVKTWFPTVEDFAP
ncbi:UDP-N-acetylmuramoyl-tripeptide--D-alanyl-D-alanine ligase [Trichothermofontia sp.]